MEILRTAKKLGNSAGVVLPKKLLGSEVRIIVVNRPLNIKKEAMKLVSEFLSDVIGISILNRKPLEFLVVTGSTKRIIETPVLKAIIMPLSMLKNELKLNFILRRKMLSAHSILNRHLFIEFKKNIKEASGKF